MRTLALSLVLGLAATVPAVAQTPLETGTRAPDFTLPSATAAGVGQPVRLADFKGNTVVLAFFYKARTPG